jgi:hypothetical protein
MINNFFKVALEQLALDEARQLGSSDVLID